MPKTVNLDGVLHSFPDDASDDEIQQAVGGTKPALPPAAGASARDVRLVDNAIDEKAAYSAMLGDKKLNTRDKGLYLSLFTPAHEQLQNEKDELTPSNFSELEAEIKRTKDPKIKEVLHEEHGRMKASLANILGIK